MLPAAFGAAAERTSPASVEGSGSEKLLELFRRVLLAGVPSVVPFGPEMRIVDDPAGVLDGTFALLWLRVRK